ncbi:hypothetical protein [Variovorax saccharolyticus]|uniref:hypothetical protein n=1 Tax=Variovorax saccharolyticus TaxID=3053516 RepID=UPI002577D71D|nr:hypothetical protein [Variovorax sp. J31P216]MDM0029835.1 hypothetical protein [Variovorax sp. J31P216]
MNDMNSRERVVALAPSLVEETSMPRRGGLALALGVYQLLIGTAAAAGLVGILLRWDALGIEAGVEVGTQASTILRPLVATVVAAMLGAVLHGLVGLHIHAAILRNFNPTFTGSYLLGPFAAALLAVGLFAVLQGGLLVLGGDPPATEPAALRAVLFHAAVGLLAGLAFDTVVLRLDGVAQQIFGRDKGSSLAAALEQATAQPANPDRPAPPPAGRT